MAGLTTPTIAHLLLDPPFHIYTPTQSHSGSIWTYTIWPDELFLVGGRIVVQQCVDVRWL